MLAEFILDEDSVPCEGLDSDTLHAEQMRRGGFRLLQAICEARGVPMPQERTPSVVRRPVAKPLWPAWYKPPRRARYGNELLASIAADFGLTVTEMRGAGREPFLVDARAVVAMVLRERGLSYPQIARMIGRKDHSTVLNLTSKFDIFCRRNPIVHRSYERHREQAEC